MLTVLETPIFYLLPLLPDSTKTFNVKLSLVSVGRYFRQKDQQLQYLPERASSNSTNGQLQI